MLDKNKMGLHFPVIRYIDWSCDIQHPIYKLLTSAWVYVIKFSLTIGSVSPKFRREAAIDEESQHQDRRVKRNLQKGTLFLFNFLRTLLQSSIVK